MSRKYEKIAERSRMKRAVHKRVLLEREEKRDRRTKREAAQ